MAVYIRARILTNSHQDKICGFQDDQILKIKIRAKPVKGQANRYLVKFLSEKIDIPKSKISISMGKTSKHKVLKFSGVTSEEIERRIKFAQDDP